jgi:hypothetical protein
MHAEQKKRFLAKVDGDLIQKILKTGNYLEKGIPQDLLFMLFLQNLDEGEYTHLASNWFHILYQGSVEKVIDACPRFQSREMLSPLYTGEDLVRVASVEELFDLKLEYLFLEEYFKRFGLNEILSLLAMEPEPLFPENKIQGNRVALLEKRFNFGI